MAKKMTNRKGWAGVKEAILGAPTQVDDAQGRAETEVNKYFNNSNTAVVSADIANKYNPNVPLPKNIQTTKSGEFNKEKGGFVTEGGQIYPTTNPDFKPQQTSLTTNIDFQKDGSIKYTPKGGEPVVLSREEYKVLQGEAGNVTDKVKQLQQGYIQETPSLDLKNAQQIQQENTGVDLTGGFVGGAIQGAAVAVEKLSSFLPEALRFGTKKSIDVTKAEQGFADYSAVLDNQINLYQQGKIPFSMVERTFKEAEEQIIQLQAQTKNMGQLDLRFWLDQGLEIEAQIQREISILETKKASLGI